jgi:hypothetical protein
LDSFRDDLSYSLPLLVGFDLVEVDHGGRLSAMGGVGPLVVVVACCRFRGHEDKIVTKELESGYDETEVQP